jgi:hypothetical protein
MVDRSSSLLVVESSSSSKSHPVVGRRRSSYSNASTIVERSSESSSDGDVRNEELLLLSSCLRTLNLTDGRRLQQGRTTLLLIVGFVVCNRGLGTSPLRPEENVLVFRIMTVLLLLLRGVLFCENGVVLHFGGGAAAASQRLPSKCQGVGDIRTATYSRDARFTSSDDFSVGNERGDWIGHHRCQHVTRWRLYDLSTVRTDVLFNGRSGITRFLPVILLCLMF